MTKVLFPAASIIVVSAVLLFINEYTETTVNIGYALIFIIAGMFLGMALAKRAERAKNEK